MAHNVLNDFWVRFILAESGAKCVAQVVYGKVANQHRLSPFGAGLLRFLFVVALVHSFADAVDLLVFYLSILLSADPLILTCSQRWRYSRSFSRSGIT